MQRYFKKGRVILALIFIIALLVSFGDIRGNLSSGIHKAILYLQFTPSVLKMITPGTAIALGFVLVLVLTFLGGRIYCSTICPLGILQDVIIFLRRKVSPKKRLRFKKALNVLRYSFLAVTILSLLVAGILFVNLLDPYAIFGRMASHIYQPVLQFINNTAAGVFSGLGLHPLEERTFHLASFSLAFGMLGIISIMAYSSGRLYCNSVCPVGTLLGLVSKLSLFKIKIEEKGCTKCGKCQAACKANCIDIKTLTIDESRCINCYNCLPVCDEKAIGYKKILVLAGDTSNSNPDLKRRFVMAAAFGYFASKALPLSGQQHRKHKNKKIRFTDRGTIAPPGAKSIDHIKDKCVACHLCVSVCPTKVLQPGFLDYGFTGMNVPKMDYGVNFCNYECTKCIEVCPTGALLPLSKEEKKLTQIGKVQLRMPHCIVESESTACGSCSEHCPTQAVRMVPYYNGLPAPEIDPDICIGCGACEYACPVTDPHPAIFVASNEVHVLAAAPEEEQVEFEEAEEFPF
jgi:ferredoxin